MPLPSDEFIYFCISGYLYEQECRCDRCCNECAVFDSIIMVSSLVHFLLPRHRQSSMISLYTLFDQITSAQAFADLGPVIHVNRSRVGYIGDYVPFSACASSMHQISAFHSAG